MSSSSSSTSLTTATSAAGGTLINVASLVSQLMTVEQQPLILLQQHEASYVSKLSALGGVQSALSTFQTAMAGLSSTSQVLQMNATSSNTAALSATASNSATAGTYSINVNSLAQGQQLAATGQASLTSPIGTGASTTLTFNFGTISGGTLGSNGQYSNATFTSNGTGSKTVTINSSNNSLQGIASAINSANIGVTASIVNDGSSTPYRLVLSSNMPGASNSMQISASGDSAISSLLSYDPSGTQNLTQTVAAQSANFTVNGLSVTSNSNTTSTAIPGVTLNLQQTTASPLTLSVAQNTSGLSTAVNNFVQAYNSLNTAITSVASYNASTQTAGPLLGDFGVQSLQSQIRSTLNTAITANGAYTTLSSIGVTFQTDGSLSVNTSTLNSAISSNPNAVAALFGTMGSTTDSLVNYNTATTNTQPGTYAVNVTSLATQASVTASASTVPASTTIAAGSSMIVNLDGTLNVPVALSAGTYTPSQLAAMIQAAINGTSAFSTQGSSVAVGIDNNGYLTLMSNRYGSASQVEISDGTNSPVSAITGVSTLASIPGADVAGTINGAAARGSGQYLTSTSGNSNGLQVQIMGGSTGARGSVTYSQGYGYSLNSLTNTMLSSNGPISSETAGINSILSDMNNQQNALNQQLNMIQAQLTSQYTALNNTLSGLNSTQQYLTQQINSLQKA